jgi:type IV secretory pathway protease TraF
MAPTLQPGDFLVAIRRGAARRGALVVVEHPARPGFEMVKRVEGIPGDTMDGRRLGAGQYWVAGDDRAASTDSRTLGPVEAEQIRGVVRVRYWPPSRVAWLG